MTKPNRSILHFHVQQREPNIHSLTMARQLDDGHFLVVEEAHGMVREYLPDGQVAWEVKPLSPCQCRHHSSIVDRLGKAGRVEFGAHAEECVAGRRRLGTYI